MKKNSKLSQAAVLIFVLPLVILMTLFFLFYTPIDWIRYRFSNCRREMRRLYGKQARYTWLITLTDHYKMLKLILQNDLPILFVRKNENPFLGGYFYYNQALFLADMTPYFDDESNLNAYIESEKDAFHECVGFNENAKCERVVFLMKEKDSYGRAGALPESTGIVLTYNKKNFAEKIHGFLSNGAENN